MEDFHFAGRVTAIDSTNKAFTLQLGLSGRSQVIATDTNTEFEFGNSCSANNFSCLATGQIVKVEAPLPSSGSTPVARKVELFALPSQLALFGLVSKVDVAQNQFQLVLRDIFDEGEQMQDVAPGVQITVQIASQATFSINTDSLTLPAGLNFASVSDMMVGQVVQFHPIAPFTVTGTAPNITVTLNTDNVRLQPSPVTATISAVNGGANPPNFVLSSLPALFSGSGVTSMQVDVLSTTKFINTTGLAGLSTGKKVSVGGLLFNTGSTPTMVAERVFLRTE